LLEQILKLREKHPGPIWLGGVSYGGRQASMLAAETPGLVDRLLLLSYPLHAPGKPTQLRTAHFPKLRIPALFVHGARDPFGTPDEVKSAITLIPAPVQLLEIEGAGHDLGRDRVAVAAGIAAAFLEFDGQQHQPDPK
jgi:predicted alpha/beta-hydrolase family hydrolase